MKRVCYVLSCLMLSFFCTTAYAIPINVASLYGTATANGYWGSYTPDLAIDGQTDTRWQIGDKGTLGDPNWLTIDLGTSYLVTSIDLFWQGSDGYYAGYTTQYNVYYSSDNTNWTLVGSGTFVDETSQITDHFDFGAAGQSMQYVKYEVDGGTHWSSISEISVWADDGSSPSAPVPAPATILLFGVGLGGLAIVNKRK